MKNEPCKWCEAGIWLCRAACAVGGLIIVIRLISSL